MLDKFNNIRRCKLIIRIPLKCDMVASLNQIYNADDQQVTIV